MSKSLINFSLSKTAWRTSGNWYNGLRNIMTSRNISWDSLKTVDQNDSQLDRLSAHLRLAESTSHILKIVNENYRRMDDKQSVQALKNIFALQREERSHMSTAKLVSHPDFEKICKNIKRYSGVIQLSDAVDSLKALAYVGVSSKSAVIQVLLQIVRGNVNHLSIPQILFLDFLLKSFEKTPLVAALQIALPMVFQINLSLKMNYNSPEQMADCLHYAIRNDLSEESIDFVIQKLEQYPGEFDGAVARNLVNGICMLRRNSNLEPLLNRVCTDMVVNIDNVSIIKMEICLSKLAHKYTNRYSFYYQEVLFDTCANYIVDHNIGFKRAIGVARNMARLHHFHKKLADYISTCIYENPTIEKDAVDIYSMAIYFVLTDYQPMHWEHLKEWMRGGKNMAAENRKEILWIRFASALCVLDIYKIDVLTRALKEDYINHLLNKKFPSNFEHYFVIWQCIKTYKPDLLDLLPSDVDPKNFVYSLKEDFPLEGALQKAFGGDQFILTNLFSKLGVHIDHVLIFNNSSPVPLEIKNVKFIEDITLENESQQL